MSTGAGTDDLLSAEGLQIGGQRSGPIDLTLRAGDRVGVVATQAEEASRLLQVLARLRQPVAGHLAWRGTDVTRRPRWLLPQRLRDNILLIWANPYAIFAEDAEIGALVGNRGAQSSATAQIMASGLSPGVLAFQVRSLSGMERVRLALAYAEKRQPQVILVDDVFSSSGTGKLAGAADGPRQSSGRAWRIADHQPAPAGDRGYGESVHYPERDEPALSEYRPVTIGLDIWMFVLRMRWTCGPCPTR